MSNQPTEPAVVDPIIETAADIAEAIFNDRSKARRVRGLAQSGVLPCFLLGGVLAIRRSRLREVLKTLEQT
jgi:hypothetical protein